MRKFKEGKTQPDVDCNFGAVLQHTKDFLLDGCGGHALQTGSDPSLLTLGCEVVSGRQESRCLITSWQVLRYLRQAISQGSSIGFYAPIKKSETKFCDFVCSVSPTRKGPGLHPAMKLRLAVMYCPVRWGFELSESVARTVNFAPLMGRSMHMQCM